jgi:hypothetical protein
VLPGPGWSYNLGHVEGLDAMTSQLSWPPAPRGDVPLRILLRADPSYFKHLAIAAVALAETNRFIYLESDVVVVADLPPFWNTALGPQLLAAASDHFGQRRRETLGIPDRYTYVNTGVVLLGVDSWRRQALSRALRIHRPERRRPRTA